MDRLEFGVVIGLVLFLSIIWSLNPIPACEDAGGAWDNMTGSCVEIGETFWDKLFPKIESPIVVFNNETNQYVCTVGVDCVCENMNKKEEFVYAKYPYQSWNDLLGIRKEGFECLEYDETPNGFQEYANNNCLVGKQENDSYGNSRRIFERKNNKSKYV